MLRYDFGCPQCGHVDKDVDVPNWNDATKTFIRFCSLCHQAGLAVVMEKKPAAPNFLIGGFSAKNGYGLR